MICKNINDTYGHHAGDIVLRSFSLVALEQKRAQDTFGRLGGEGIRVDPAGDKS